MRPAVVKLNKEKVTVTLSPRVLREVDRWCKGVRFRSRSAAIEHLVEQSIRADEDRRLEAATEAYYRSLTPVERQEDRNWVKSSSRQAIRRFSKKE